MSLCKSLDEALGTSGDGAEAGLASLRGEVETEGVTTGGEFARRLTFRSAIPCLKFQHMRFVQPQLTTASTPIFPLSVLQVTCGAR